MQPLFLGGAVFLAALTACGGSVDASSPAPAPATNAPTNSTANGDGCARACDRMTKTCSALQDPRCVESCSSDFSSAEQKDRYAACIDALSCEDIQRGVSMNAGPIGECFTLARER
jgi:hypothetical protein